MPAILFDLDGTLHDRIRGLRDFVSDQFSRLGGSPGRREQFVRRFVQLDANGKVWKDEVYRTLLREFEFGCAHAVGDLVTDYLTGYPQYALEMTGATDALQALIAGNLKIGIVSNGRSDLQ
ncbi:MAG: HAD hydrolase-like protein, partial [Gammaproteobacteria bacterium]